MNATPPTLLTPPSGTSKIPPPVFAAAVFATIVGLGVTLLLAIALSARSHPPLTSPLTLYVAFTAAASGTVEPLITTGKFGAGDFLMVRYQGENTAMIFHDYWGFGGPNSAPFTYQPGRRYKLQVEMPTLLPRGETPAPTPAPVRVELDGNEILSANVPFYPRAPDQIYFAENPIGGSLSVVFGGELTTKSGRRVRGIAASLFSPGQKMRAWLAETPWQLALVLGAGLLSGVAAWRSSRSHFVRDARSRVARMVERAVRPSAPHHWFAAAIVACSLGFAWLVTLRSFNFIYPEVFSSFYDYQAASFLKGRLDVPEEAIKGEAFMARGETYGYFGPTPGLLRLPFVATGVAFGKLSRAFMLLYFVASLIAAYLILRVAAKTAGAPRASRDSVDQPAHVRPSPFATVILLVSAGWGSTIFFLGSRGLVFHEAILAGIAFALWSCWFSLRYLARPESSIWIGALICGILSVHCRPPTGLFSLTFLGCISVVATVAAWRQRTGAPPDSATPAVRQTNHPRKHLLVGALCAIGFLSLNGLAYLKFGTFDPAPLRISEPYQNPDRIGFIEGKSFHLVNIPYMVNAYVLWPNFRIEPQQFPWIYFGAEKPRPEFPKAKIDLPDHTLALPYSMPSLFWLATLGGLGAAIALPRTRLALGTLWTAVMPMSLALFAAIATAQRYTGDWVPFLICAAAFGLIAVDRVSPPWRGGLRAIVVLATLGAVAVTVAHTLHYQGAVLWGVPAEFQQEYLQFRSRVDAFFAS